MSRFQAEWGAPVKEALIDITTGVCAFVLVWAMVAGAFVL